MKKILIADELSFCRQLFSLALRHEGYEVVTAEDGLGAIDAIKREKPQLIFLETRLGKIDGIGVLRVIRSSPDYRALPVFMLTETDSRLNIVQAGEIGVQEYILKSRFDYETVMGKVRKCIGTAGGEKMTGQSPEAAGLVLEVAAPAMSADSADEIPGDMEEAGDCVAEGGVGGRGGGTGEVMRQAAIRG